MNRVIKINNQSFYLIGNDKNKSIDCYKIDDKKLIKATETEIEKVFENKKFSDVIGNKFNIIIGIMSFFKDKYIVFKIKNTKEKNNSGYRCDQKGKLDILRVLEQLLKENMNVYENMMNVSNKKELCIDQELLLRHYNDIKKNDAVWFLNLEYTILLNIMNK